MNENEIVKDRDGGCSLAERILERSRVVIARLRHEGAFARIISGAVTRAEYEAWLVQMHRWIRNAIRALRGHADAMTARAARDPALRAFATSAHRHVEEEVGHDQLILDDLSVLWGCSKDEVLGRIERTTPAPSAVDWERMLDGLLARYPVALMGASFAIEAISNDVVDDMLRGLVEMSDIEGIASAVAFLRAHCSEVEDGHLSSARMRIDAITDPVERSAIFYYANASLVMFESMMHFVEESHAASLERELATV